MSEFYWKIVEFDGTETLIPPVAVEVVKRRWDNKEPIHTTNSSIPANQIKKFEPTDKIYGQQRMVEAQAQAFREPMLVNGNIQAKWVKRSVPQQLYRRRYEGIPGYRSIGSFNGLITIAWKQPIHTINHETMEELTNEELKQLAH